MPMDGAVSNIKNMLAGVRFRPLKQRREISFTQAAWRRCHWRKQAAV